MTCAIISESLSKLFTGAIKRRRLVAVLLAATFTSVLPAGAQSADTWKSVAIIGGSTAAGAYIGHKVAGTTGAYVGAAVGASAGYAIDRHRRQNENYNGDYPYADNGNYPDNGGYYGDNGSNYPDNGGYYGGNYPNSGDGGYYGNSGNTYPDPSGYSNYATHRSHGRNRR